MSFRVFGIPHYAALALSSQQLHAVGEVHFQEHGVADNRTVHAVRVDPVTVIDSGLLEWARAGSIRCVTVQGDRMVLDMANGHWEYEIGEYSDTYQGIVLTLVSNP